MFESTNHNTTKNASIFFFILMLLTIPISYIFSIFYYEIPEEYHSLCSILISQGYLLIGLTVYLKVTHTSLTKDLRVRKYKLSSFFLSILVLIAAAPMSTVLNALSQLFAPNSIGKTITDISQNLPIWIAVFAIGCLPAFIEEVIYRGILQSAFKKHSIFVGIVMSSLSFGLMHGNFNQIPYAIYLGTIFAFLVEATGSLASTMVLHMLFNGMNTIYLYVLPKILEFLAQYDPQYKDYDLNQAIQKGPTNAELLSTAVSYLPMALIGIVFVILLIKKIAKLNDSNLSREAIFQKNEEVKPFSIWLVAGWIICLGEAALTLIAAYMPQS